MSSLVAPTLGLEQGLVDPQHLFDGFSSNAVMSIIAVMIIGAGLDKTGMMSTVAAYILKVGGTSERRIIPIISGTVGIISSFMQNVGVATTELFGPFQVVVEYGDDDIDTVLKVLERMSQHLTAAVVSADSAFQQRVLAATVNGTTYCGMRARTTGAPQNHWFGPCGDPRAAGIGTPEAIVSTWSGHREVIMDQGPLPDGWSVPPST